MRSADCRGRYHRESKRYVEVGGGLAGLEDRGGKGGDEEEGGGDDVREQHDEGVIGI